MASRIVASSMTLTFTGVLNLDGEARGFSISEIVPSVTEFREVIVDVPTASQIEIIAVTTSLGIAGLGSLADSKFIIVQNLDDTNFCRVRFNEEGGETFDKRLNAGQFFVFYNKDFSVNITEAAFAAFVDVEEIQCQFDTADSQLKAIMVF